MGEGSANETSLVQSIPGRVYLVGGAVRDALLGLAVHERDWLVVGAGAQALLDLGFREVGRDFPVFLHPQSGEEYALARRERKTGVGYRGFAVDASATVTLQEDLGRRDLTINAIAQTLDGEIIDPYHGRDDLDARILRHVSPAFREDPVRLLRVARFAARLAPWNFTVAADTLALMRDMSASGELAALVPERVWRELALALHTPQPSRFFTTLAEAQALAGIFPELAPFVTDARWPTTLSALDRSAGSDNPAPVSFACLGYALGAGAVAALCKRLRAPRNYRDNATILANHWSELCSATTAYAAFDLLEKLDALRRPSRLPALLAAASSLEPALGARIQPLQQALAAARRVSSKEFRTQGLHGLALAQALREARRSAVAAAWPPDSNLP
ncbi:MAG: multifunctional CCA tRNA nucleotidyl transferase/2'3'-cyclic phosphodiesterase/2'nucleotidase/phosphatase [Gammaproteobacteria bacterium]|nr:multifunctional CCA tRNA nucleotidyl transferase/2'3'-cyclic phosphodiesterase/2'nucleotidase/phosphatase [Gammaproteobacteria bacterium]